MAIKHCGPGHQPTEKIASPKRARLPTPIGSALDARLTQKKIADPGRLAWDHASIISNKAFRAAKAARMIQNQRCNSGKPPKITNAIDAQSPAALSAAISFLPSAFE
jgi:hypothetical protein